MSSSSMMTELAVLPELSGMGVQVPQEPAPPTLPVDPSTNISSSTMDPEMYFAAKEGNVLYFRSVTKLVNVSVSSFLTPQKNTVLHIAVRFLQLEFAAQVLRSDPSLLFQPNSKGDTPLHLAARYGHIETVRLLVSNCREQQCLHQQQRDLESGGLMQNNNISITTEWIRATNSDGNTALHEALMTKNRNIALMLLEEDPGLASCENNAMESPLYLSASLGFYRTMRRILDINVASTAGMTTTISHRGRNGQTPLHAVAMFKGRGCNRRKAIATLLCEKMPHEVLRQMDKFGRTALHYSASTPAPEVTRILLGKDHTLAYLPDKDGLTPLFFAAALHHWRTVNIILEHCPDCGELRDLKDQNVLHFLMANRKYSPLLKVMRHPDLKGLLTESSGDGNTLLHRAAEAHHRESLSFLWRCKGINLEARNGDGLTALDLFQNWKPVSVEGKILKGRHVVRLGAVHDGTRRLGDVDDGRKKSSKKSSSGVAVGGETTQQINDFTNTFLVVSTLFAAITFSALFQPPGGYSSEPTYLGAVVFGKRPLFVVFLWCDAIAFCTSLLSVIWLVAGMFGSHKAQRRGVVRHLYLFIITVVTTIVAFTAAAYLVTEPKSIFLAISVLVIPLVTLVTHYIWLYRLLSRGH